MPSPRARPFDIRRAWRKLLDACFALLCLRFLVAVGAHSDWAALVLGATGLALTCWRPALGPLTVICSIPLLSGLEQTQQLPDNHAGLTLASAVWLGLALRNRTFPEKGGGTDLLMDLLATTSFLILARQVWQSTHTTGFWTSACLLPVHSPSDPHYFLTAAFIWLHGLFHFRALRSRFAHNDFGPGAIQFLLLVNSLVFLFFFAAQALLELPVRWNPGFQSPYEDIATFGIVGACLLIFWSTLVPFRPSRADFGNITLILLLAVATAASWSRATWLTSTVFLGLVAMSRLARGVVIGMLVVTLGIVGVLNWNSERVSPVRQPYLYRLTTLVRFENLEAKSLDRVNLYHKATDMIGERPWFGHGLGSFFQQSTRYARSDHPTDLKPQFPHNLWLQLAAEQGFPYAFLFTTLMGCFLWQGARSWLRSLRESRQVPAPHPNDPYSLSVSGLTLAVGAYLQANLTWDILTVHATQPFFFWFLVAALGTATEQLSQRLALTDARSDQSPRLAARLSTGAG
jgi:O-antigen ligase